MCYRLDSGKIRGLTTVACLLFLSSGAQGQGRSEWTNVLQAANKEARVVLYTSMPPTVIERVSNDFQKAYPGIRVEASRSSAGPLVSRITQERDTKSDGGDVLVSTDMGWYEARAAEKALITPAGPAAAEWPKSYLAFGMAPVAALEPFVILYNTNVVKVPIRGYPDLLNPELKGRIGASEASSSTNMVAFYHWLEKEQGSDYLVKLAALKPRLYPGTVTPAQAVASGEIGVSVAANPSSVQTLIDQGAPIKYVVPNPARGFTYVVAAVAWSKRPNAAQVLVDYLTSRRGQQAWNGKGDSASPLRGIEGSLNAATISASYNPKEYPPEVVKSYVEKWNKLFKK